MLTLDLVQAERRGKRLHVAPLDAAARLRAMAFAEAYGQLAVASVGRTRAALETVWAELPVLHDDRLLAAGLRKLWLDRCVFEEFAQLEPAALRREVFEQTSAVMRGLADDEPFDRQTLVDEIAARHGIAVAELERLLYADLRQAQRLLRVEALAPEAMVEAWPLSQAQAVLLRAVEVVIEVHGDALGYRHLFRRLKFLRLLHRIEPLPQDDGYRLRLDGPFSLFSAVTKYGLQLALLLPDLAVCERWQLVAEVRWGKARRPLRFELDGTQLPLHAPGCVALPEEVERLQQAFATDAEWQAEVCLEILRPPTGQEVCVPDLVFVHTPSGARVYLEVLGFWSRAAVWRRIELVQNGLAAPLLLAVPARLRVSEEALETTLPAALYVYKGSLNARRVRERLEALRRTN